MIKTALEVIEENEPTFLDGCQIFEKNQLENIKVDMTPPGPTLRAISFSTNTQSGFDPNNPSGQPALDRTVYHNGQTDDLANGSNNISTATAIYADAAGTTPINLTSGIGEAYWDGSHYISIPDSSTVYVHLSDGEIGG